MTNAPIARTPIKMDDPINNAVIDTQAMIAEQLKYTAQTFPPSINAGAFLIAESARGPILPQYGTKERDRILRIYDKYEYNGIWQGAVAGLIKKIASSPWEIMGNSKWTNFFQVMLQNAQFGRGWDTFIKRLLRDYLTQDYGAWIELIGPGATDGPLVGPVIGVAHLDSGRCFVTGNPTWPVVYYSLMTGALHRMHHTRVVRFVDQPDPDERFFGIGLCALSRCIGAANREIRMGRYVEGYLDDKPKPGITSISGLTETQFKTVAGTYAKRQASDDGDLFGKSLMLFSLDTDKEIKVNSMPFAQTPEKFDFIKYTDLDVNSVALGIGVDRQELWELAGRMLGSAQQSNILAQKAEGKAFGDIIQNLTRIINTFVLPVGAQFQFRTKNTIVDAAQADNDNKLVTAMHTLAEIPNVVTGQEIRKILVSRSATFADAFAKDTGSIELQDTDVKLAKEEVHLEDDAPIDKILDQPIDIPTGQGSKEIGEVQSQFVDTLVSLITSADQMRRLQFGVSFRAQLRRAGVDSFIEGMHDGGVFDDPDDEDMFAIQDWLLNQSEYVTGFANEVYARKMPPQDVLRHARMWANKSLSQVYHEGLVSADRNGSYVWRLGQTEHHCPDCERLDGQVHRLKQWYARGWLPKSDRLSCSGILCDCSLIKTDQRSFGRF